MKLLKKSNLIQSYERNKKYFEKFNSPDIIVVGMQSSGKSSLLNEIIQIKLLPVNNNRSTKSIVYISILYGDFYLSIKLGEKETPKETTDMKDIEKFSELLNNYFDQKSITNEKIEIVLKLPNVKHPIQLVDLPGI
jgi:ribosome biogenesis GTPase A